MLHFNIAKCKHLKYGTNTSPYEYYMNDDGSNSTLNVVPSEKDLGVWITSKPNFSLQCESLGLIKRINFYQLDKRIISNTLQDIRSPTPRILCFWNPYLAKCIDKLEQIQQRATKLFTEIAHLPYEARLRHLNLHSLYCRRQRGDLIEVYKLVTHLI